MFAAFTAVTTFGGPGSHVRPQVSGQTIWRWSQAPPLPTAAMQYAIWATMVGSLLLVMGLTRTFIDEVPFSGAMVYLLVGVAVSPWWIGLASFDLVSAATLVERGTEAVVLISLFTSGMKLSAGLADRQWLLPVRLATVSMLVTVLGIALTAWKLLGMPIGAAILLGGILAPTDPVLASDVQVNDSSDRDRVRFALTGEGGLNDGTAFPIVMLGLGLLGLHDLGPFGLRWVGVDVVWSTACGLTIGIAAGVLIGRLVLWLRRDFEAAVGADDFLALGLVAAAYGVAILCQGSGFLAVFAAGFALRQTEKRATQEARAESSDAADPRRSLDQPQGDASQKAADHDFTEKAHQASVSNSTAAAFMAYAVSKFNEQLERVGEAVSVIVIGCVLWAADWHQAVWWFVPLLFFVIRPVSVAIGLVGSSSLRGQRRLVAWFGIRGIGSVFYLAYAITHGLPADLEPRLTAIVLSVVVASVVLHGVSVTPLMKRYELWSRGRVRSFPRDRNA